jgi:hypothetical protein
MAWIECRKALPDHFAGDGMEMIPEKLFGIDKKI